MTPGRSVRLTRPLNQQAVYWANAVPGAAGGREFDPAQEIMVRWENHSENRVDKDGRVWASKAVVYVSQAMLIGEYLYLGGIDTLDSAEQADPFLIEGAFEIADYTEIPDHSGTSWVRAAWL